MQEPKPADSRTELESGLGPTPIPVTPLCSRLPLRDEQFTWERFEAFCRCFIEKLPGVQLVEAYGGKGSKQLGIDFIANLRDGCKHVYQCKHVASFARSECRTALDAATFAASKKTLLLSCQASSSIRDEIHATNGWSCWDIDDISNAVRKLPPEAARELVRVHFGAAWIAPFLGVPVYSAFVPWQNYFELLLHNDGLLRHVWPFVGRRDTLGKLDGFLRDPEALVAIVPGHGGIGKSRLLLEFAKRATDAHPDAVLRFVANDVVIDAAALAELPQECIVVLDDAHHHTREASQLTDFAKRGRGKVKLLLATRPYAIDSLGAMLAKQSVPLERRTVLATLGDLSREEVLALARLVLGPEYEQHAEHLVTVGRDSPLVIVIGGRLLATKELAPELLASDADFRAEALVRFQDAMLGNLGDDVEPRFAKALLRLLSAVAPVDTGNQQFLEAASAFLAEPKDELVRVIDKLERSALLRRRRNQVRITPDVLADYLLEEACATRAGAPTGYAMRVYSAFPGVESGATTSLLRNLAELDWRTTKFSGTATELLKEIWAHITALFRASSHIMRDVILTQLEGVAYLQPKPVLDLIDIALSEPPGAPDEIQLPRSLKYPYALPVLLRRTGYHLEHLSRCCEVLWKLGRDEQRLPSGDLPAPLPVIARFAEYQPGIPFTHPMTVLDFVERHFVAENDPARIDKLLGIIDPLFSKVLRLDEWRRDRVVLSGAPLHLTEGLQAIRERGLKVFAKCAISDNTPVALSGIERLARLLQPLYAPPFVKIAAEDHLRWHPEQRRVLALLLEIAQRTTHPVIRTRIVQVVRDRVFFTNQTALFPDALEVVSVIPQDREVDLIRVLTEHDWEHPGSQYLPSPVLGHLRPVKQLIPEVADQLVVAHPDSSELADRLNSAVRLLDVAGLRPDSAAEFFRALWERSPTLSVELAEHALRRPDEPLAGWFTLLLMEAARASAPKGSQLALAAVASGHHVLCHGVARALEISNHPPLGAEPELLERLLRHGADDVRAVAARALRQLGATKPAAARRLVLEVNVARSQAIASDLFSVICPQNGPLLTSLTDDDMTALVDRLDGIRLDSYYIAAFLAEASKRIPDSLLAFLMRRVRGASDSDTPPIPHLGFNPSLIGFQAATGRKAHLKAVRDELLVASETQRWWLPHLFHAVALGFDASVQAVILEWIDSGDEGKLVEALALLERDSPSFVFSYSAFVQHCVRQAYATSAMAYRQACFRFTSIALDGLRMSGFGRAAPQDIAVREQALMLAATLPLGSPERQFYEQLAREATDQAQRWVLEDED
ncbi:MAG: hypothetical protein IPH13_20795 [Planctomycetes bacterium]|nr:hypothetical protein [Planctomycetota bacterium]